jgi:hypothetical protein
MKLDEKDAWSKAIAVELTNLKQIRVWDLLLKPQDTKELGGRWVFATKANTSGLGVEVQRALPRSLGKISTRHLRQRLLLYPCAFY